MVEMLVYLKRSLKKTIIERLQNSKKAVVLYGARQVGKTTLANKILDELELKSLKINADEIRHHQVLSSRDSRQLTSLVAGYDCLLIDEAQRIPEIGINLKILIDSLPDLKILVTGSSSLELADRLSEPLTGRKWAFKLYPISQLELSEDLTPFELQEQRDERLIWGSYPEIFSMQDDQIKSAYLNELAADYLLKDVLQLLQLKRSDKMYDLLRLLAFQIGQLVSAHELATQLSIATTTVTHYLDVLEKAFVIQSIGGFSRNLRKEVSKSKKYYFYDLGIRNALIQNYNPPHLRADMGSLWENFLIMERFKLNEYRQNAVLPYFWRTYTGAEIDYIEEQQEQLSGFEIKWNHKSRKVRIPASWQETYPNASWELITPENWLEFIVRK